MKTRVIVTVNVRKPELLETATLTLRSVRVGFPTAEIIVASTSRDVTFLDPLLSRTHAIGARYQEVPGEHYRVLNKFTSDPHRYGQEQTIFLDSDLIFYENCEGWDFSRALAGHRIPEHVSHYTQCVTAGRLHTSFLVVNQIRLEEELNAAGVEVREFAPVHLWRPQMLYHHARPMFYDTASNLFQAIGGAQFTPEQLDCYTHIFCGSARDVAKQHLPAETYRTMEAAHELALRAPNQLRGFWRQLTWV